MKYTPQFKQTVLKEYNSASSSSSFSSLSRRFCIDGGREVVRKWYRKWDGSVESLKDKHSTGRPRILSHAQINRHIVVPIRDKNRRHLPIHYRDLVSGLQHAIRKKISLRTIQRYGKEKKVREKNSIKRMERECR
jgi:transposase-like protein